MFNLKNRKEEHFMENEKRNEQIISLSKKLFYGGVFTLFFSLVFWLIFVEGNRDYGPWTRTVAIIIFVTSIVLFLCSRIAHSKAKDTNSI